MWQECVAVVGELHAMGGAQEQYGGNVAFQRGDAFGHRLRRNAQLIRCALKLTQLSRDNECADAVKIQRDAPTSGCDDPACRLFEARS